VKKYTKAPRQEDNRISIEERPIREADGRAAVAVEDATNKVGDAAEESKESSRCGSDKQQTTPRVKQHVTPRDRQQTTPRDRRQTTPRDKQTILEEVKVIDSRDGASPRVVTKDFTQADHVVLNDVTNNTPRSLDSTSDDSEGVSRGENSTSQEENGCAKLNNNCDTDSPTKEDGLESGDNPDTWKDYVSKRKVVDTSNYETFARTRSKTVPTSSQIGQFPTKECVKELMSPSTPTEQQIKIRTYGTRSNKINLQNRPIHSRYYYNNLMNHDRILKRRDTQENRCSVSSSRDSVSNSLEIGQRPQAVDQDNHKSHIGLPSISQTVAKKRT
jgi:hypothetical protein